jgi:hypothetical protein
MADDAKKDAPEVYEETIRPEPTDEDRTSPGEPERDRTIADFVRRAVSVGVGAAAGAVSAGVGVAANAKDDIMRAAAGEVRQWLEHLNINEEVAKALAKLVIEVKTEVRFRPTEEGKLGPDPSNDFKVKPR